MKKIGLVLLFIILINSCSSSPHNHTLRISTTTWIGYTPLFYAKEKGWLKTQNIKLINVVSLSENMYLYKAGNSDAYCGTQYEHSVLKKHRPNLVPVMLFDRSNGGDIIMSNQSVKQLQESNEKIDAYLEMDSINFTLLNDFIKTYKIDESRINYINRDQTEISILENKNPKKQILIITYVPYDAPLKDNGFKEILSTKNGLNLLVIDALFTQKTELIAHKKQFQALKEFNNKAIEALKNNPKEFFETIRPYMNEFSYEDFSNALNDIEWINKKLRPKLKERLRKASFPTKDLL